MSFSLNLMISALSGAIYIDAGSFELHFMTPMRPLMSRAAPGQPFLYLRIEEAHTLLLKQKGFNGFFIFTFRNALP